MNISHISISNFCNISNLDADIAHKTIIKGFNKEGKSTIRNAVLWVMTDKLSDGSSAGDNIRPHDESGKRIDGVDIKVSITVSIGGAEYILSKTQKQKWVKKRGSEDREFQGNENIYEISGIPKSAKDFEAWINENICSVKELPFCLNANTFLSQDAKKRRAKVLSLGTEFSNDEIIDKYPEFSELRADLNVGTIEELTARSKKAITELKKRQSEIPTRIDEANNSIVEMDFAELELERNAIHDKLQAIEVANAKATDIRKEINKAKINLVTIKEKLSGSAKDIQHNLSLAIANHKNSLTVKQRDLEDAKRECENLRSDITDKEMRLQAASAMLSTAKAQEMDDSFICPKCGQILPAEMQDEIRNKFEQNKREEVAKYEEGVKSLTKVIEELKAKLPKQDVKIKAIEDDITKIRSELSASEMELSRFTVDVDYENNEEYKAVEKQISDLEVSLNAVNTQQDDKEKLLAQLSDVDTKLAQKGANIKAEERIGELKGELKDVSAKIIEQERILHLLEQFNIKRIEMLEASVNSYFDIIRWRFFSPQINGGWAEVCKAEVGGTDYDTLLNKSDRLLCQLDLCKGFMKAANVTLPLMVDDCESIDSGRIPEVDNQLIMMRREDCKLTVEGA